MAKGEIKPKPGVSNAISGELSPAAARFLEAVQDLCRAYVQLVAEANRSSGRPPRNPDDRILLSPEQAAKMLSIGRDRTFELIHGGVLPCIRFSERHFRLPLTALERWVEVMAALPPEEQTIEGMRRAWQAYRELSGG